MNYVAVDLELINKIRERINSIEKQRLLIENNKKWLQLTSSLNVLVDCYRVVQYYCDSAFPENTGGSVPLSLWSASGVIYAAGRGKQHFKISV